ncbi:MAG: hypothetical protein QM652_00280 [Legionella sp.]|uniref:hypothetical protein n=1 Tax=Legionella sp. TaxID=459 RepID=UPI0039E27B5A
MGVAESEIDVGHWFSTYGVITAERILGRYQIKIATTDLVTAIKSPFSFYHKLLEVPFKNVLNGIVLQQAKDYLIYGQKLFIDYLLSSESSKDETAQGVGTRESLESERKDLITLGEEFHHKEIEHNNIIASSQSLLITITHNFNVVLEQSVTAIEATLKAASNATTKAVVRRAINHALIHCDLNNPQMQSDPFLFTDSIVEGLKTSVDHDIKAKITKNVAALLKIVLNFDDEIRSFAERAEDMKIQASFYRSKFYNAVLRILELIKLLPEYKIDPEQDANNRESLDFDKTIGDE